MNTIHKLTELFTRFPGIGPRQAGRFVYFLLSSSHSYRSELIRLISTLKDETKTCTLCSRFHSNHTEICSICADKNRDNTLLMLVEKDVDLDNIERARDYNGYYFVIGGRVPILDKEPSNTIRENELKKILEGRAKEGLKEIILAFSVNPEGENTTQYIQKAIESIIKKHNLKISTLGRGLSTGSELEYSDSETIKNALKNRM
ncbi:MAG TPA: recombination protein RecR [Candidatus Kaiserbacteria bacterium]|nr:recombination protein RecR [Candidatus Kaiserbacteria bacterium]